MLLTATPPLAHVNISSAATSKLQLGPIKVDGGFANMESSFTIEGDPSKAITITADSFEHALVGAKYLVNDAAKAAQHDRENDSPHVAALTQAADGTFQLSEPQRLISIGFKPQTWWANDQLDVDVSVTDAQPGVRAVLVSGVDPTIVTDGAGSSHTTVK